jgi:hypothetical protein
MKRLLFLLLLATPLWLSGQVVNFAKTLPERAFSLGVTPSYYFNNSNVGLRSIGVDEDQAGALAIGLSGGYGINYSLDLNAKIIYVVGGKPFIGADIQYLIHEARYTYISVIGGLHYWDNFGVDITGLFTYMLKNNVSISGGLDFDVNYDPDMDGNVRFRGWLPVNVGFNVSRYTYLYAEYDLQISQWSWGIASIGVNFIFK